MLDLPASGHTLGSNSFRAGNLSNRTLALVLLAGGLLGSLAFAERLSLLVVLQEPGCSASCGVAYQASSVRINVIAHLHEAHIKLCKRYDQDDTPFERQKLRRSQIPSLVNACTVGMPERWICEGKQAHYIEMSLEKQLAEARELAETREEQEVEMIVEEEEDSARKTHDGTSSDEHRDTDDEARRAKTVQEEMKAIGVEGVGRKRRRGKAPVPDSAAAWKETLAAEKTRIGAESDKDWKAGVHIVFKKLTERNTAKEFADYQPVDASTVGKCNDGHVEPADNIYMLDFSEGWANSTWNVCIIEKMVKILKDKPRPPGLGRTRR
ncbi:hypothetical protein C8F01DRAFT_1094918 [Mycena amicta]|nr:hypothetical protein C8F01DRAFT_1094918 [Mycena amicta]